jgi:hypothetical protein
MNARELLQSENVIKANPLLATFRTARLILLISTILMSTFIIFFLIIDALYGGGHLLPFNKALFGPLCVLASNAFQLMLNISQGQYWKRIEQRRFAAVQGNQLFLASEQPTFDRAPLPLPITIKLRQNKGTFLLLIGATLLMSMLLASLVTWFVSDSWLLAVDHLLIFLVVFSIFFVPISIILLVLLLSPLGRPRITVTEGGLISKHGTKVIMPWYEARLFAMYETFGKQKSGSSITYELSSARDIVRWTWVLRRTLSPGLEPVIPQDEYNRQMQALLSLVVARTGLPLYDLREDLPRGGPKD